MCEFCEDIPEWDSIKSYASDEVLPDYYLVKMDSKYCLYQNSRYADFTEVALDDIKFCPYCGKSFEEEKEYLSKFRRDLVAKGGQHAKKVFCIDTETIYYSCKEAARNTGLGNERQATHIADVCNGKRNICNGFKWRWYTE